MTRRLKAAKKFEAVAVEFSKLHKERHPGSTKFIRGFAPWQVKRAFRLTGLDLDSPRDWQILATMFATVLYADKEGRPQFWDLENLKNLGEMVRVELRKFPDKTEEEACDVILERWKKLQGPDIVAPPKTKTLMRKLQEAKKRLPILNFALAVARADGQRAKKISNKKTIAR
jgi:hypothetical protein